MAINDLPQWMAWAGRFIIEPTTQTPVHGYGAATPSLLAEAWDEGVSHGFDLARGVIDPLPNPYRSAP